MKSSGSSLAAGRDGADAGSGGVRGGLPGLSLGRTEILACGGGVDEIDVSAGGAAGEEDAFQCGGAQDASVQVGEDDGEVGGAEIQAAMALKLGAVVRWRTVSIRWRP